MTPTTPLEEEIAIKEIEQTSQRNSPGPVHAEALCIYQSPAVFVLRPLCVLYILEFIWA